MPPTAIADLDPDTTESAPVRARKAALDAQLSAAVDVARDEALACAADFAPTDSEHGVGDWLDATAEGDRVVTHLFACTLPGYRGWQWAVTLVRASRSKAITVSESVLLPGGEALRAPDWVPWSERIEPGDLGVGDVLATAADDERLVPGYAALSVRNAPDDVDADEATGQVTADDGIGADAGLVGLVAQELGLGRPRVLSPIGIDLAASRWYEGDGGPDSPLARAAPAPCATCGFLVPLRGSLASVFGVCANEWSPSDGHVVSYDHGCGAHSEAEIESSAPRMVETVVDELRLDPFLDDDRDL